MHLHYTEHSSDSLAARTVYGLEDILEMFGTEPGTFRIQDRRLTDWRPNPFTIKEQKTKEVYVLSLTDSNNHFDSAIQTLSILNLITLTILENYKFLNRCIFFIKHLKFDRLIS